MDELLELRRKLKSISVSFRLAQLRSTKCIMSTHMHNVLLQRIFYRDCGHNMPVPKPTMCPLELLEVVSKYKDQLLWEA